MRKIGIMGGTFDPIHHGHIMLGRFAYEEYGLDQVVYMPSGQPPHKMGRKITNAEDRAEMVKLAIAPYPQFQFSDFEITRQGKTYTAQTLQVLTQQNPDVAYYFIIGADSLFQILNWYKPEQIFSHAILLAATRNHVSDELLQRQIALIRAQYQADIRLLHSPNIDVSSEELRRRFALRQPVGDYMSAEVASYVEKHGLYTVESQEDASDAKTN